MYISTGCPPITGPEDPLFKAIRSIMTDRADQCSRLEGGHLKGFFVKYECSRNHF